MHLRIGVDTGYYDPSNELGFTGLCILLNFALKHGLWVPVGTGTYNLFRARLSKHNISNENRKFSQPQKS